MEHPRSHPLLSPVAVTVSSHCEGFPGRAAVIMNLGDLWTNSAVLADQRRSLFSPLTCAYTVPEAERDRFGGQRRAPAENNNQVRPALRGSVQPIQAGCTANSSI